MSFLKSLSNYFSPSGQGAGLQPELSETFEASKTRAEEYLRRKCLEDPDEFHGGAQSFYSAAQHVMHTFRCDTSSWTGKDYHDKADQRWLEEHPGSEGPLTQGKWAEYTSQLFRDNHETERDPTEDIEGRTYQDNQDTRKQCLRVVYDECREALHGGTNRSRLSSWVSALVDWAQSAEPHRTRNGAEGFDVWLARQAEQERKEMEQTVLGHLALRGMIMIQRWMLGPDSPDLTPRPEALWLDDLELESEPRPNCVWSDWVHWSDYRG